jgi:hypothetical protein
VLEYAVENGELSEPERAELRGQGELGANLFALRDVALEKLPELMTQAAAQIDGQDGKVERIVVRRLLPQSDAVRIRIYVDSPRLSGHVDFDANGTPVGPEARAEL